MIEEGVAAFIGGNVMIVVGTRDADLRPRIGRGCGAWFERETGQVRVLISASQWAPAVRNAVSGAPIATTFVDPITYAAYQIKGRISEVAPATAADSARAEDYVARMLGVFMPLGVSRLQLSSTLVSHYPVAIGFWPAELFVQTPGPGAGRRVGRGEVA